MQLIAKGRKVDFPRRPLIMGILNLGADSFSGDGIADPAQAVERAEAMVREGADIIDIGAESARTNRAAVSEEEERDRLTAFLKRFHQSGAGAEWQPADEEQVFPPLLSINTWRPGVAGAALAVGGDVLNDIGGLPEPENAKICAGEGAALVIMHSKGEPKVAHTTERYGDVIAELERFFEEKIGIAERAGLEKSRMILDPGIDFAKQRDDNLRIYRELGKLARFGLPLLLPVSRKTVIGDVLGLPEPAARDAGTVAAIVAGMLRGASIFRVHNIPAAFYSIKAGEFFRQN